MFSSITAKRMSFCTAILNVCGSPATWHCTRTRRISDGPSASRRIRTLNKPCGATTCQEISTPGLTLPSCTFQPSRDASQLTSSHAWMTACGPCSTSTSLIDSSAPGALLGSSACPSTRRQNFKRRQFKSLATRHGPCAGSRSNLASQEPVAATPRAGSAQPMLS